MTKLKLNYEPQPKQAQAHSCPANEILYGGAAGPGKSHYLRMEAFIWCCRIPGLQVYLFRRTFPELEKNHILPSLEQFPKGVAQYKDQKRRWEFNNGAMLHFCHVQFEKDVFNYQGAEIHILLIDELTTFTEFIYLYLFGRNRCALDIPEKYRHKIPSTVCASNPGGVGHQFVKQRWVDFAEPFKLKRATEAEGGMVRCYIPGLLEDNPILQLRDPGYIHKLNALPEPFRTAYMKGDWEIFLGQAFNFNKYDHVIPPMEIPENAEIYMTYDWGYGAPFSILWFWVDADGRLYLFDEWYGCEEAETKNGIRLPDSDIAIQLKMKEQHPAFFARGRDIIRYTGHDSFSKKPDYKGGGQGKSTAEIFTEHDIHLIKADPNRLLKIRQFRERLKTPVNSKNEPTGDMPMLLVYDTCHHFIRTIPTLQTNIKKIEDINDKHPVEDHCYDSVTQICMARPLAITLPATKSAMTDKRIDNLKRGIRTVEDEYTIHAKQEEIETEKDLYANIYGQDPEYVDWEEGDLVSTMH
ncbi:MAG: Terminase-like family protein [Bacteriovoracaceae bacterium]|nr:Terminase-like family protein [candidate division KSB1 bacterium]MBL6991773.1 Terminase-like family protein [Bacteriovoracaceae bacterium]